MSSPPPVTIPRRLFPPTCAPPEGVSEEELKWSTKLIIDCLNKNAEPIHWDVVQDFVEKQYDHHLLVFPFFKACLDSKDDPDVQRSIATKDRWQDWNIDDIRNWLSWNRVPIDWKSVCRFMINHTQLPALPYLVACLESKREQARWESLDATLKINDESSMISRIDEAVAYSVRQAGFAVDETNGSLVGRRHQRLLVAVHGKMAELETATAELIQNRGERVDALQPDKQENIRARLRSAATATPTPKDGGGNPQPSSARKPEEMTNAAGSAGPAWLKKIKIRNAGLSTEIASSKLIHNGRGKVDTLEPDKQESDRARSADISMPIPKDGGVNPRPKLRLPKPQETTIAAPIAGPSIEGFSQAARKLMEMTFIGSHGRRVLGKELGPEHLNIIAAAWYASKKRADEMYDLELRALLDGKDNGQRTSIPADAPDVQAKSEPSSHKSNSGSDAESESDPEVQKNSAKGKGKASPNRRGIPSKPAQRKSPLLTEQENHTPDIPIDVNSEVYQKGNKNRTKGAKAEVLKSAEKVDQKIVAKPAATTKETKGKGKAVDGTTEEPSVSAPATPPPSKKKRPAPSPEAADEPVEPAAEKQKPISTGKQKKPRKSPTVKAKVADTAKRTGKSGEGGESKQASIKKRTLDGKSKDASAPASANWSLPSDAAQDEEATPSKRIKIEDESA